MKGICRLQERIFCKCRGGVEYNTVNSKMSNFDYRRNMGEKEISMCSNQNFFKEISKNNSRSNLEIYVSPRISGVSLFHTNEEFIARYKKEKQVESFADGNELIIQKSTSMLNFYYVFPILIVASRVINILLSTLDLTQ